MGNYKTYKQADSRWGSKNYNGSSTMAAAGCGPTSVANLAYAINTKVTPWTVAQYMQKNGYAIRNNGTAWAGIPAAMKYFGLKDVKNVASMSDVFKYIEKGYCAVFLMSAGTRGGVCWTTAGHFISVTGYKYQNGQHWFYTRDPGGRNHDGWYCYETQMRGLIPQVWVGYVEGKLKKTTTTTTTPTTTTKKEIKGIDVSAHQSEINWEKVKKAGYTFVIIRAGYGKNNKDKMFENHIKGAIAAGLDVGIYWFSYAYTLLMAINEAKYCLNIIKPYKKYITMPIYFDFEYDSFDYAKRNNVTPSKSLITSMTGGFCKTVDEAGYTAGFYYNYDYKKNRYNMNDLKKYSHWYALYSTEKGDCDIQQYSSNGSVNGISGKVDVNKLYNTSIIKKKTTPAKETWQTKACKWAKKIAADNNYHYMKWSSDKRTHECPICEKHSKGTFYGWNCIGFAFACWHHGGELKNRCNCHVVDNPTWEKILKATTDAKANEIASAAVGIPVKAIRNGGKAIPQDKLKKGDVCSIFNGTKYEHTYFYMGDGKVADSTGSRSDNIQAGVAFTGRYKDRVKVALRPV